jgi:hypothetical protein
MRNYKIDIYDESPLYDDVRNPVILIAEINIMTSQPLEPFIAALKNSYSNNFKFYISTFIVAN